MKVNGKRHQHASKIVHNHYLDIAWDLFEEHQDPMTKLESLRMEKQLAISYKKKAMLPIGINRQSGGYWIGSWYRNLWPFGGGFLQ